MSACTVDGTTLVSFALRYGIGERLLELKQFQA